jgi:hypothetical protein
MDITIPRKEEIKQVVEDWWRFEEGAHSGDDEYFRFGLPIKRTGILSRDTILKSNTQRKIIFRAGNREVKYYSSRNYSHPEAHGVRRY